MRNEENEKAGIQRRELLRSGLGLVVIGAGGWLVGCKSPKGSFACTDTSSLSSAQMQSRINLNYVDRSPQKDKRCENCAFFKSQGETQCGGCTLVAGPIHPKGYCNSWAAKQG